MWADPRGCLRASTRWTRWWSDWRESCPGTRCVCCARHAVRGVVDTLLPFLPSQASSGEELGRLKQQVEAVVQYSRKVAGATDARSHATRCRSGAQSHVERMASCVAARSQRVFEPSRAARSQIRALLQATIGKVGGIGLSGLAEDRCHWLISRALRREPEGHLGEHRGVVLSDHRCADVGG